MRRITSAIVCSNFRRFTATAIIAFAGAAAVKAQTPAVTAKPVLGEGAVSLALTFDTAHGTITKPNSFWLYGGGAEVSATFYRGLGIAANIVGLHSGNSGGGVPINLLVATFGPRYSHTFSIYKHGASVYGEGLIGEANGFSGVYPQTSGAIPSSDAFALQVGGGVDIGVSRHFSIRALEASWIRSELPNATTNVQNNVWIGAGLVVHSSSQ
jgi:hypothetical protein